MKDISVIIIDDSKIAIEHSKSVLKDLGFKDMKTYYSPSEVKNLDLSDVDLAVIDIVMPSENGIELSKFFKEKFPKMKIILVSTLSEEQIQMDLIEAQVDDFLAKPLSEEILSRSLESIFNKK